MVRCQLAAQLLEARGCLAVLHSPAVIELLMDACDVSTGSAAGSSSGTPAGSSGKPKGRGRTWQLLSGGISPGERAVICCCSQVGAVCGTAGRRNG